MYHTCKRDQINLKFDNINPINMKQAFYSILFTVSFKTLISSNRFLEGIIPYTFSRYKQLC
jgi:hypothetical protein